MNYIQRAKLDIMKLRARNIPTKMSAQWQEDNRQLIDQLNTMSKALATVSQQRDKAYADYQQLLAKYDYTRSNLA